MAVGAAAYGVAFAQVHSIRQVYCEDIDPGHRTRTDDQQLEGWE